MKEQNNPSENNTSPVNDVADLPDVSGSNDIQKGKFYTFRNKINGVIPKVSDDKRKIITKSLTVLTALLTVGLIEALVFSTDFDLSVTGDKYAFVISHIASILALLIILCKRKIPVTLKCIPVIISPVAAFLMTEFLTHNPFIGTDGTPDMDADVILLNAALYIILLAALVFITGRTAPAVVTVTVLPLTLGLINYFTLEFRGTPLFPWDLASYGTAASVISEYSIEFTPKLTMIIALGVLICVTSVVWNIRVSFQKKFIRPALAVVSAAVVITSGLYINSDRIVKDFGLYPYLFTPKHLYKSNGFAVSFLMNLKYATVDKPEGYDSENVEEISSNYTSDSKTEVKDRPNIIVIMNEAFADMSVLADYETNQEVFRYISSLDENTVKGNLHVSIVGGNTPNSEFEFLTGMSMAFLPAGSIPYQQFINGNLPSLSSQLDELGYRTVAMHPYAAAGWERDVVYPYLGFEETYFNDSPEGYFNRSKRVRSYVSDLALYYKIEQLYNTKADDEPLFVFAVTMQNHSGYSKLYENFMPMVKVEELFDNISVSNYMSLISESDLAFSELVEFFSKSDEETVILMFGDHQPNDYVAVPLMNQSGVILDDSNLEDSEKRYIVPYILWSNYELDTSAFTEEMSLNYLSSALMSSLGLPMTASQKMVSDIMNEFPVINGRCFKTSDGKYYSVSDYEDFSSLSRYAIMQYNYLFDDERLEAFFKLK